MKTKKTILSISLLFTGIALAVCQDTTPPINITEWWKDNMYMVLFGLVLLMDMILDRTKAKEKIGQSALGNILLKAFSILMSRLGKRAYKLVRPSRTTKIMVAALLLTGASTASAQGFKNILRPVTAETLQKTLLLKTAGALEPTKGVWLPRIKAAVVATEYRLSPETSQMEANMITKTGVGLSYTHYITANGNAFPNYGADVFLFLPTKDGEKAALGITGTIMRFFTAGILYNIDLNRAAKYNVGFLTGVSITF